MIFLSSAELECAAGVWWALIGNYTYCVCSKVHDFAVPSGGD
jgi:hypothetical protein